MTTSGLFDTIMYSLICIMKMFQVEIKDLNVTCMFIMFLLMYMALPTNAYVKCFQVIKSINIIPRKYGMRPT